MSKQTITEEQQDLAKQVHQNQAKLYSNINSSFSRYVHNSWDY